MCSFFLKILFNFFRIYNYCENFSVAMRMRDQEITVTLCKRFILDIDATQSIIWVRFYTSQITVNGHVASFEITSVYFCTLQAMYAWYFSILFKFTPRAYCIKDMDNCVTQLWNVNIRVIKNRFIVAYLKMWIKVYLQ